MLPLTAVWRLPHLRLGMQTGYHKILTAIHGSKPRSFFVYLFTQYSWITTATQLLAGHHNLPGRKVIFISPKDRDHLVQKLKSSTLFHLTPMTSLTAFLTSAILSRYLKTKLPSTTVGAMWFLKLLTMTTQLKENDLTAPAIRVKNFPQAATSIKATSIKLK